jgi:hypothetical protein
MPFAAGLPVRTVLYTTKHSYNFSRSSAPSSQHSARLGSYEVSAILGEGGMGAVYRARDIKLNRDVALKVLLPEVANVPERVARFRREAQGARVTQSSAHRRNSRARRIRRHDRARPRARGRSHAGGSDCARTTAARRGAADRAPDRGGTRGGARAGSHPPRSQTCEHQGARRRDGKGPGLRAGQSDRAGIRDAIGQRVDLAHRCVPGAPDWPRRHSWHRVVHGAGAGERPGCRSPRGHLGLGLRAVRDADQPGAVRGRRRHRHPGEGHRARAGSTRLPTGTPPHAVRVLRRCLQKDLRLRFQHIGDARFDLDQPIAESVPRAAAAPASRVIKVLLWAIAVTASLVAAAMAWRPTSSSVPPHASSVEISYPEGVEAINSVQSIAITPDGRTVAMIGSKEGARTLLLRSADGIEAGRRARASRATAAA